MGMLIKLIFKSMLLTIGMASILTLTACGKSSDEKASDTATPAATTPVSAETPAPANTAPIAPTTNTAVATAAGNGEKVYQASCHVCHDTGNLGSPRMGDKAAWKDRIAQGKDVLYTHAIQGFTGKSGTMPPKGTSTAPDADIKAAVDYIVAKSQ